MHTDMELRWMAGQCGWSGQRGKMEKESETCLDTERENGWRRECRIGGASGEFQCWSAVQREQGFSWSVCGAPVVFQPINPLHVFNTGRMCRQRSAEGCMAITQRPTSEEKSLAREGAVYSLLFLSLRADGHSSAEVWKGMDLLKLRPLNYSLNDSQCSQSVFWVVQRKKKRRRRYLYYE